MSLFHVTVLGVGGFYVLRGIGGVIDIAPLWSKGPVSKMTMEEQLKFWQADSRLKDGVLAIASMTFLLRTR